MAAVIDHGHHGRDAPHAGRVAAALLLAGLAVALTALVGRGDLHVSSRATPPTVSEHDAIATWLETERASLFPGYTEPYIGSCPASGSGTVTGLCSALDEDLGDHRIHTVGVFATDWGGSLLLERGASGWTVIDAWPWPELGTLVYGPPWSPQTAIGAWWADNAESFYGTAAVHVRECDEIATGDTGQTLLCSSLAWVSGGERVYLSGRAGASPDVRLVLRVAPDHTWTVTGSMRIDATTPIRMPSRVGLTPIP